MTIGILLGSAVMPTLFKQDPSYFYKGRGRWSSGLWYALSRSLITKGKGNWQANYCDTYLPPENRNVGFVFQAAGIGVLETAFANVLPEFISKKLTPRVSNRATKSRWLSDTLGQACIFQVPDQARGAVGWMGTRGGKT